MGYKKLKKLIEQRFDSIEAEIKSIQLSQSNINRRLEVIEDKLLNPNKPSYNPLNTLAERELSD